LRDMAIILASATVTSHRLSASSAVYVTHSLQV